MSREEHSKNGRPDSWIYLSLIFRGEALPKAKISETLELGPRDDSEWDLSDERFHFLGELLDTWNLEWEGKEMREVMASMSEALLPRLGAIETLRNEFECHLDLALFYNGSAEPQKSIEFDPTYFSILAKLNLPLEITIYSRVEAEE